MVENKTDLALSKLIRKYSTNKKPIKVDFRRLVNWMPYGERATHLMHFYPAKLLIHIPHFFLANNILSKAGDTILDPFCGTGTVMLESILSGRDCIGFDTNPLACLIARVKTTHIDKTKIQKASYGLRKRIENGNGKLIICNNGLRFWFLPKIIKKLQCIYANISTNQDVIYN